MLDKIRDILRYELESNFEALKRLDNWIYIISVFALLFAILANYTWVVICLFIVVILQMKRDYDSGEVINHIRKKRQERLNKQFKEESIAVEEKKSEKIDIEKPMLVIQEDRPDEKNVEDENEEDY